MAEHTAYFLTDLTALDREKPVCSRCRTSPVLGALPICKTCLREQSAEQRRERERRNTRCSRLALLLLRLLGKVFQHQCFHEACKAPIIGGCRSFGCCLELRRYAKVDLGISWTESHVKTSSLHLCIED